jgi:hypothetical protein
MNAYENFKVAKEELLKKIREYGEILIQHALYINEYDKAAIQQDMISLDDCYLEDDNVKGMLN